MDYLELAIELSKVRKKMAQITDFRRFINPDSGESFVLSYLGDRSKPVGPKEIGDVMNISSARIAVILNQLEAKGMVRRRPDSDDGRHTVIEMLPAGMTQRQKNMEDFNQCAVRFLKALGPEDAVHYVRLQNKIVDIYTKK